MEPDGTQIQPCPVCGHLCENTAELTGHLEREHPRDGGAPTSGETKSWPPAGIETK